MAWLAGDPARWFYGCQAAMLIGQYVFAWLTGLGNMYSLVFNLHLATRPAWMPHSWVKTLADKRVLATCLYTTPLLLVLCAIYPQIHTLRIVLAIVAFDSVWGFNARSNWHKDYCMFYNICIFAFVPEYYQQACSLGVCIHFIVSTGSSKWHISKGDWFTPGSCRAVFSQYQEYTWKDGAPAWPALSRCVTASDACMLLSAIFTMTLECFHAPAVAFYPNEYMKLAFFATLIMMHVGIFFIHSGLITVMYFNNAPSYVAALLVGSVSVNTPGVEGFDAGPYLVGVAIGLFSVYHLLLRGKLLDENFPSSPFALFSWAGWQWSGLCATFWKGKTRLVMSTKDESETSPLGRRCREMSLHGNGHEEFPIGAEEFYSLYLSGAYDEAYVLRGCYESFNWPSFDFSKKDFSAFFDPEGFTCRMSAWLKAEKRLFECHSGKPLQSAWFVEVDDNDIITKVLNTGGAALESVNKDHETKLTDPLLGA